MARSCPVCEGESLRPLRLSPGEVETCPRCHGVWFGRGQWERLPDRPPIRAFLDAARRAPARHGQRGQPAGCPACRGRLARVVTSAGALDVCVRCEGLWLEAGSIARLEGVTDPQARPAGRAPTTTPRCAACARALQGGEAFAFEGDAYCARCRPPSAVPASR